MSAAATERYLVRFRRVLEFVDAHLGEDLPLERLCSVAAFSKFHFHRQFAELLGVGVCKYVQLSRLKRAGYRLAFRNESVTAIAFASGYDGPEAFARAFKRTLGQSPSAFRRRPAWDPWHATYAPLSALRSRHMQTQFDLDQVGIVELQAMRVAALEHRGDPLYDDPETVPPQDYRFDLCAATQADIAPNPQSVIAKTLQGGRCAKLRLTGSDDALAHAVRFLYSSWLPQSGEELRDSPLFLQRVRFFPDVPEHEAIVDIYLPLESR